MTKQNIKQKKSTVAHICSIRRVTSVGAGGKTSKISALVVVGDGAGNVGFASGKSSEVPEAVKKASRVAEKNMMRVSFYKNRTIHHDVSGRHCGALVYLRKSRSGSGIIAGGTMRFVFEALGIQDIVCKSLGSSNPHNVIKATFKALANLQTPKKIARLRGVDVKSLFLTKEVKEIKEEIKE